MHCRSFQKKENESRSGRLALSARVDSLPDIEIISKRNQRNIHSTSRTAWGLRKFFGLTAGEGAVFVCQMYCDPRCDLAPNIAWKLCLQYIHEILNGADYGASASTLPVFMEGSQRVTVQSCPQRNRKFWTKFLERLHSDANVLNFFHRQVIFFMLPCS